MQPWSQIHSCETTQDFAHESSPHYNTGFNLHEIKSSQETNSSDLRPHQYLNFNTLAAGLVGTFAHERDVWLLLSIQPSLRRLFWGLHLSCGWTFHQPPHRPKPGHYLFTDSRRLIWKRCTKLISSDCVWPALVSEVFLGVFLKYASCLWAVPALSKDKRWFEGLLRCIPPPARRAVSGRPAGCYSAAGGRKITIQLLDARGKLIQNFLLASVPSLSCFHVNGNNSVFLIQLSPGTLMNSTQPAERFLPRMQRIRGNVWVKEPAQVQSWITRM